MSKYDIDSKIFIYIQAEYIVKLKNDARQFEVFKKNNKINLNLFLNKLIKGYYDEYREQEFHRRDAIVGVLDCLEISDEEKQITANKLLKTTSSYENSSTDKQKRIKVPLRATKDNKSLIDSIIGLDAVLDGISQYFARMIISYCKLPMSHREQIIFKDNYDKILRAYASQSKHQLVITTKDRPDILHKVIPYKIVIGKEEMFNYLICAEIDHDSGQQKAASFRINRIQGVNYLAGNPAIDETVKNNLLIMEQYAPQYAINSDIKSHIKLSAEGVRLFRKIYFGRPNRIEQEDTYENGYYHYFFKCSIDQLFLYFRRFGAEAEVISPNELRNMIISFHSESLQTYLENQ